MAGGFRRLNYQNKGSSLFLRYQAQAGRYYRLAVEELNVSKRCVRSHRNHQTTIYPKNGS
jgi:hypothetical protein